MPDARAAAYQKRIAALFAAHAETITTTIAASDTNRLALISPLDNATASLYFDSNEAVGLVRPALAVWVEGDSNIAVDEVFTRDAGHRVGGDIYTVRKLQSFRQGDTVLLILALCD